MIDSVAHPELVPSGELAPQLTDRRFGIGADGVIFLEQPEAGRFRMRMFNPDGSEAEMCGNGIRCLARMILDEGYSSAESIEVETGAGLLSVQAMADRRIRVDMGKARLSMSEIGMNPPSEERFINMPLNFEGLRGTAVSMGNPHVVIVVDEVAAIPLEEWGPVLEHHEAFPSRVNVHFIQVNGRDSLIQRTWERGAGVTLACGTGACACAVASCELGLTDRSVDINLPGGRLSIDYGVDGVVLMTGAAETVFNGRWGLR